MNIVKSLLLFPPCPQLHSEAMHRASPQPDQRCVTLNPKLHKKQSRAAWIIKLPAATSVIRFTWRRRCWN